MSRKKPKGPPRLKFFADGPEWGTPDPTFSDVVASAAALAADRRLKELADAGMVLDLHVVFGIVREEVRRAVDDQVGDLLTRAVVGLAESSKQSVGISEKNKERHAGTFAAQIEALPLNLPTDVVAERVGCSKRTVREVRQKMRGGT